MKKFIIAGGSSGIGLALTKKLSDAGNQIFVLSRNDDNVKEITNVTHYRVDITDSSPVFPEIKEPVNGLVYAPGSKTLKPFKNLN